MIIVIEGCDGSGKSTQARLLAERMKWKLQCFPDRTTPVGKLIDGMLKGRFVLGEYTGPVNDRRFGLAHFRDHALVFQSLQTVNRCELGEKLTDYSGDPCEHLVCDRYAQSGFVFGGVDGLDVDHLKEMHALIPPGDINILIHVHPTLASQRLLERGMTDHYDRAGKDHLAKIIDGYEKLWDEHADSPTSWFTVDGEQTVEGVHADILKIVRKHVLWED